MAPTQPIPAIRTTGYRTGAQRRLAIITFIHDYIEQHGYPPSTSEIQQAIGFRSSNTCSYHISRLKRAGLLQSRDRSYRTLTLTPAGVAFVKANSPETPRP